MRAAGPRTAASRAGQQPSRAGRVSFKRVLLLLASFSIAACGALLLFEVLAVRRTVAHQTDSASSSSSSTDSGKAASSASTWRQDMRRGVTAEQQGELATDGARSCPPATVDWSAFTDPGPLFTGSASIHATNWEAAAPALWLIYGLKQLGYTAALYTYPEHKADAELFAQRARMALNTADPSAVSVREMPTPDNSGRPLRLAQPAAVFIYVCSDPLPDLPGLGLANVLVVLPSGEQRQPQQLATSGSSTSNSSAGDSRRQTALSTYDFLIYTSPGSATQQLPHIMPLLEQLQLSDQLFPLVDIVSLPAAPTSTPSTDPGITISMSAYGAAQRPLLNRILTEFKQLHRAMSSSSSSSSKKGSGHGNTKLVVCSWLLPGIAQDLPFLYAQLEALSLPAPRASWFEYRDDSEHSRSYEGLSVQWHVYNPEDKPHATATAAMPAGVLVLDCTGVLGTQQQLGGDRGVYGPCPSVSSLHNVTLEHLRRPHAARLARAQQVVAGSTRALSDSMRFRALFLVHRAYTSKVYRYFIQQTQAAYRARLTPAVQSARARSLASGQDVLAGEAAAAAATATARHKLRPGGPSPAKCYAAVIVEARPHYAFLYVVLNAAWYLPGWTLHVVHTRLNAGFVKRILQPHVNVKLHQLDTDNVDIDHYNLLMKNASFWQMFDADHVLLFQTDSLILRPGLERFTVYDYVGAPWHLQNERWSQPALKAALPEGVGNGGFSMRSVQAMVEIANTYGPSSPLKEQEDVFFATHIQTHPSYTLADRRTAYSFCLEVPCADVSNTLAPHAMHAAYFYVDIGTGQRILAGSLDGLRAAPCVA